MPLDFKEQTKEKEKEKKKAVSAPTTNCHALQLEGQVLPSLIHKVGDIKSGRITRGMVEAYLDKSTLIYDRELLEQLFNEADYKKEGSLDARSMGAALSGRYPKREHTSEWRQLVALLLGIPELVLQEDSVVPKHFSSSHENHGFNTDSIWNDPPPPLPPVSRRRRSPTKSRPASGEFVTLTASLPHLTAGGGEACMRTTGGAKSVTSIGAELAINRGLTEGPVPASTFAGVQEYDTFSKGLELAPQLGVDTATSGAFGMDSRSGAAHASPTAVRAWAATLPPSAVNLNPSALHTLRNSIRSTHASKPDFHTRHTPLSTCELDLKKTLGLPMDVTTSMARTEPVRGTKVLFNASFLEFGDYANKCRTSPSRWFNEQTGGTAGETHKFPW